MYLQTINSDYQKKSILPNNTVAKQALTRGKSNTKSDPNKRLKQGIWVYFFLLLFEGALRKWVLPGLSTPLLIIRDPVAMWLILVAWQRKLLPASPYLIIMVSIGVIGIITAKLFGHGNLLVALYGARILLIHFPMIFVIGSVFNTDDVIKMGKMTILIAGPMAVLTALQFYSPQSAWVNRGVGGNMEGAGFSGAMGYFRPPGTFSFTNGNTLFFSFVAPFVFYFWLNQDKIKQFWLIVATLGLLAAIPLSISRSLFFSICVSLLFTVLAAVRKPKYLKNMILAGFMLLIALAILNQTAFFQTATAAFTKRFTTASESEGGVESTLADRYLGGLIKALKTSTDYSFFGAGLGAGSNVGGMLLNGEAQRSISEGDWGRWIGELGPFFGLGVIVMRLLFSLKIFLAGFKKLSKGNLLPWLLLSFGLLTIPQGEWSQPTSMGFNMLIGGLILASLKNSPLRKPRLIKKTLQPALINLKSK